MAIEFDDSTFTLPVPHPTLKLVLAPPGESDGAAVVAAFNHPSVYLNLNNPPYPYTAQDWADRYTSITVVYNQILADLKVIREQQQSVKAPQDWSKRRWLSKWTSTIRDVGGSDTAATGGRFIGDFGLQRDTFMHIRDPEERQRMKEENDKLEPGDPKIMWMIGYWLIPEYQGRGIMTAVLRTLMDEIIVPYVNAHTVHGGYLEHNPASRRVFEKCGFSFEGMVPDAFTFNPNKVGGVEGKTVGLGVLTWVRQSSE